MINENIFRAYDIRGKADDDLNDDIIRKIGIVLSEKILKTGQNKVYLGTDCRLSANRIKKSLISGLCSNDIQVLDLGMVPTPLVYFATKIGKTNCGIMITGSHNPKEDNGLKMVINDGAVSGFEIKNDVINPRRIDYIFYSNIEMVSSTHVHLKTKRKRWASDHHPVIAIFN